MTYQSIIKRHRMTLSYGIQQVGNVCIECRPAMLRNDIFLQSDIGVYRTQQLEIQQKGFVIIGHVPAGNYLILP